MQPPPVGVRKMYGRLSGKGRPGVIFVPLGDGISLLLFFGASEKAVSWSARPMPYFIEKSDFGISTTDGSHFGVFGSYVVCVIKWQ